MVCPWQILDTPLLVGHVNVSSWSFYGHFLKLFDTVGYQEAHAAFENHAAVILRGSLCGLGLT